MSYGLETYRADGALHLSITGRITRYLGASTVVVSGSTPVFVTAPTGITTDWIGVVYYHATTGHQHRDSSATSTGVWVRSPEWYNSNSKTMTVIFYGF